MAGFYDKLAAEDVAVLDRLSRLLIELRESRLSLLQRHGCGDEDELMARIKSGALPEHPAYEDYLGAKIIADTRAALRRELRNYLLEIDP